MDKAYKQRKASLVVLARVANRGPLPRFTGPLRLDLTIRFKLLGAGDLDNLAGGILDAFNGVLWDDDRQIQRGDWRIERETGEPDCIILRIEEL